jgi:hypothetical protein
MDEIDPDNIMKRFDEEPLLPFIHKELFRLPFGRCRFYQTPGDCDLSIGFDWTMGNVLFHIHILFWEIDFEFFDQATPEEELSIDIHKEEYYPFEANLDGRRIIRERLQQLAALGLEQVAPGQFGIDGVMSGLYIERVWNFSHQEFSEYVEWIKEKV